MKERVSQIPESVWSHYFPNLEIPIGMHISSPLLPSGKCHLYNGRGEILPEPYTIGHDEVKTFLSREGQIMEKLVHYKTDGYDSEKWEPDEYLGETGEERYRWGYQIACAKLNTLQKLSKSNP